MIVFVISLAKEPQTSECSTSSRCMILYYLGLRVIHFKVSSDLRWTDKSFSMKGWKLFWNEQNNSRLKSDKTTWLRDQKLHDIKYSFHIVELRIERNLHFSNEIDQLSVSELIFSQRSLIIAAAVNCYDIIDANSRIYFESFDYNW